MYECLSLIRLSTVGIAKYQIICGNVIDNIEMICQVWLAPCSQNLINQKILECNPTLRTEFVDDILSKLKHVILNIFGFRGQFFALRVQYYRVPFSHFRTCDSVFRSTNVPSASMLFLLQSRYIMFLSSSLLSSL